MYSLKNNLYCLLLAQHIPLTREYYLILLYFISLTNLIFCIFFVDVNSQHFIFLIVLVLPPFFLASRFLTGTYFTKKIGLLCMFELYSVTLGNLE